MRVLSLFDGISCGKVALERAGIPVTEYLASEVDKYAIQVSMYQHSGITRLGDVRTITKEMVGGIDLLIGGSPCQGFSVAGKRLNFEDPRSALFFEYLRILNEVKPKYFLLENVCMQKDIQDKISELLGVEPILINSNLVSAQNRKRLYWTNIPGVTQPEDKKITWGNIRQYGVGECYYSPAGLAWIKRHEERKGKKLKIHRTDEKMQMIEASHFKGYSSQRFFGIEDAEGLRYITPVECERCQTLPDRYTAWGVAMPKDPLLSPQIVEISNTQRYKMLGNGWTVSVISHIFKHII